MLKNISFGESWSKLGLKATKMVTHRKVSCKYGNDCLYKTMLAVLEFFKLQGVLNSITLISSYVSCNYIWRMGTYTYFLSEMYLIYKNLSVATSLW